VIARSAALAAWTDTRNAGASRQQDIYATTISGLADASSDASLALPIGLAVLAALAMAGALLYRPRRGAVAEGEGPGGIDEPVTETT